jgi:hypothetical protein
MGSIEDIKGSAAKEAISFVGFDCFNQMPY